jgi:hypothetical protein
MTVEPSLAVQGAIRSALIADAAVTGTVPAARIFDRNTRPELFPCCIIGDAQTALEPLTLSRSHIRIFSDLHIWTEESGLVAVKTIAGNASAALKAKPSIDGFHVVDWKVTGARFLRDPGGEFGHAVMSIEALLSEAAS